MKILFYINILSDGGAERVVANLASLFSKNDFDVTLVTTFKTPNEYDVFPGVKRIELEEKNSKKNNRLIRNIRLIKKLRKIIKSEKPDVVISFMKEANFRAIIASSFLRVKTVVSVRNDPKVIYKGITGKFVSKFIMPKASGCVFQTEEAMSYFSKKLQKKSKVILNAVKNEFYLINREPVDGKIVSIGRISPEKNHKMLIEAFSSVTNKYPNAKLEIYGTKYLEDEINETIKKYNLENIVSLKGHTNNIADVLSTADIFVLSSLYEGMPNSLMEAMAAGVPCISTDCPCGGPKMLITNYENGLLVKVNDANEMAKAIMKLLDNKEYKEELGINAKKRAAMFKTDLVFNEWKDFIMSIK